MSETTADPLQQLQHRNAELRAEVGALRELMDSLQTLVLAMDQPPDDEAVMAALAASLAKARTALDADHAALLVLDDDSGELVVVLTEGEGDEQAWSARAGSAGLGGWALERGEAVIANDAAADERFDPDVDQPPGLAAESVLVVPVVGRDRALGVLRVVNKRGHGLFSEDDQALVSLMGRFAGELLLRVAERHARDGQD